MNVGPRHAQIAIPLRRRGEAVGSFHCPFCCQRHSLEMVGVDPHRIDGVAPPVHLACIQCGAPMRVFLVGYEHNETGERPALQVDGLLQWLPHFERILQQGPLPPTAQEAPDAPEPLEGEMSMGHEEAEEIEAVPPDWWSWSIPVPFTGGGLLRIAVDPKGLLTLAQGLAIGAAVGIVIGKLQHLA